MLSCCKRDIEQVAALMRAKLPSGLPNEFVFLRHGETDWNRLGKVMGQRDMALNAKGKKQAAEAVRNLRSFGVTQILVSPLKRCQETAQTISEELGLPFRTIFELKERSWGVFEGGPSKARLSAYDSPPEGETSSAFRQRVAVGLSKLDQNERSLVISHSGVYRAIVGKGPEQRITNAKPIVIKIDQLE